MSIAVPEKQSGNEPASDAVSEPGEIGDLLEYVQSVTQRAKRISQELSALDAGIKNKALLCIADQLIASEQHLLTQNGNDMSAARENNIAAALLDRLELTPARITSMAAGLQQIALLPDPVGSMSGSSTQPSGLNVGKMRVPLGVIGMIYESRPNVTADAAALCLKSGNAVVLRGGSEAIRSNRAIAECIHNGLRAAGISVDAVQLIDTTDRNAVGMLITQDDSVDVIIPRGGKSLVARIKQSATVPVIKHLDGICHVYIDDDADDAMAVSIAINSKTYRYGICGSMETLLVHNSKAAKLLPQLQQELSEHNVELRGCDKTRAVLTGITAATEEDWQTEYLAPILSIRVVDNMQQAIDHIEQYGSSHTDAIVTNNLKKSREFTRRVDSSSVMVNAATCFADGFQYGLGAEIGISTDKLHVRGPVGLEGLTTEKYVVIGDGAIRV